MSSQLTLSSTQNHHAVNCRIGRQIPKPDPLRKVAMLLRHGVNKPQVMGFLDQLCADHRINVEILGARLGSVRASDGSRIAVDASVRRWHPRFFDCIFVAQQEGESFSPSSLEVEVFLRNAMAAGTSVIELSKTKCMQSPDSDGISMQKKEKA